MIRIVAIAALFVSITAVVYPQTTKVLRFENGECAIELPKDERARCGYLVAHENRAAKTGRTIRLPVIILQSDSPKPQPDPILRTLGGPGASSLKLARGRRSSPWLRDRDYIIFEQRGTKYAQPALECPEVDGARFHSAKIRADKISARKSELQAAKACHERLASAGIDLDAYNSAESAADIEDLRQALKLEKINLYGVSYSARLMLEVVRRFPSGIRSVVLESTLPPEANYDELGVDSIVRTLDHMFATCRSAPDCAAAYPGLESTFYRVVRTLNADPTVATVKDPTTGNIIDVGLNGDDFATWIVDYLFSNEPSATVEAPYLIALAAKGNFDAFKRYANDKLDPSFYSWGMRYSVWCGEEYPFESRAKIRRQSTRFPGLKGYEVMALPEICGVWTVKRAPMMANTAVRSDIPALVLAAEYDAYTPPDWGRKAAARLSHSFFFEIPWAGHGPAFSVPCVADMVSAFIDRPSERPDGECVSKTRAQFKFRTK